MGDSASPSDLASTIFGVVLLEATDTSNVASRRPSRSLRPRSFLSCLINVRRSRCNNKHASLSQLSVEGKCHRHRHHAVRQRAVSEGEPRTLASTPIF